MQFTPTSGIRKGHEVRQSGSSSPLKIILAGISLLLIIVAVLQYHWTSQLNEAMQGRIGGSLQSSMMAWNLDLYGELSAICIALQVGPDSGARDSWKDYLQRYVEWSRTETEFNSVENIYRNPDLIDSIYIWQTSGAKTKRLLRLNSNTEAFESATASQDLSPLLDRLQQRSSNLSVALSAWKLPDSETTSVAGNVGRLSSLHLLRSNAITGWQFDATIPAIVHPIVQPRRSVTEIPRRGASNRDPVDWIVVVLNLETIEKRILPGLARRYFTSGNSLEYELAVLATGPTRRLLYSSDPGFGDQAIGPYDSIMNIFGPPAESVEGHLWQGFRNTATAQGKEWHRFSGPVWFPVIQYTPQAEAWTLVLRNRSGPLEADLAKVRRTNLMAGGLALVLLATGMFFLVIASQRAQKLAKLQLDFVASVSHELLTPLAALYSTGQNIRDGLIQDKPELVVHGSIITSETHQLMNLVNQILLFASSERGGTLYVLRPLGVSEILQCSLKNVAVLINDMGFDVEQQIADGLPRVAGDLSALSQCLQNLIVNAVKYSGKSRWIGISAELRETRDVPDEVCISVEDHGRGIEISELSQIFEPFYRSPSVIAAQIRGTGLGLAVSRRIARAMGGDLTVESEAGVGSIFTLHLPIADELVTEPSVSTEPSRTRDE
jgi:signal transduction histidine kinase